MARVPYFELSQAKGRAGEPYAKIAPLNIFKMMGHGGDLIVGFMKLGNHLLAKTALDPVLREFAIVRVGVLCGARYEIQQHEAVARKLAMSESKIAGIHQGPDAATFNELERMVMAFTDDVVKNVRASDATFAPLLARLGVCQLQELTMTIGYYMMVSRFLETFDVDLEEDPDGKALKLPGMKQ